MSQINIKCIFKLELNYILIKEITYLFIDGDQILPSETSNKWSFTNFKIKLKTFLIFIMITQHLTPINDMNLVWGEFLWKY